MVEAYTYINFVPIAEWKVRRVLEKRVGSLTTSSWVANGTEKGYPFTPFPTGTIASEDMNTSKNSPENQEVKKEKKMSIN